MRIYGERINDAVKGSIDARKLAEAWQALHPETAAKALMPALAAFLAAAREAIERVLAAILPRAWAEGWVLGQIAAQAVVQGLEAADWGDWTPGDYAAAEAVAGSGLRQLLAEADVTISSIAETRLEELAAVLEATLASDIVEREMNGPVPVTLSVGSLTTQLEEVLDNPARAGLVAQTEIARAQSAAAMKLYRETGTDRVEWSTAMDAKVCPLCDANEAAGSWPLGEAFPSGAVMPPQHPRCFPVGTLVSGPRAVAATSREYEGDLAVIVFARGEDVSVTPNHPVLTRRGWVAAGSLHEGDDVFRARGRVEMASVCPDDKQVIRRIEHVAAALAESGPVTSVRMPVAAEDFHGDGTPGQDVDVVSAARSIEQDVHAAQCEHGPDLALVGGPDGAGLGEGDGASLGLAGSASAAGGMGGVEHGSSPFIGRSLPAQSHGLGLIAGFDARVPEHAVNGPTRYAMPIGEFLNGVTGEEGIDQPVGRGVAPVGHGTHGDSASVEHADERLIADAAEGRRLADRLARLIGTDRVVEVRRIREWHGHVYNLETAEGWYFANGIVAHNCRCALLPAMVQAAA